MKFTLKFKGNGQFEAGNQVDYYTMNDKLKIGQFYNCEIKKSRILKHHNKYWLLCSALAYHFGGSPKAWHEKLKQMFMPKREVILKSGFIVELAESEAFDKCDQITFDDYYKKVDTWLLEQGYEIDQLINEAFGGI